MPASGNATASGWIYVRLELVVGQRTKGRRGTNLTRELRPIDALMMDQAAERARATMRCFLKGESLYMTPGRKGQPRPGKEGGSIYGRVRMACPARSWDGMLRVTFQSLQGVAQRTKPTSQRVRRLVWYSCFFAPPSFSGNFSAWRCWLLEKKEMLPTWSIS